MPHIIPIKDLKNTAEISELCRSSSEPIFITKNGYGDMVIMSMVTYENNVFFHDVYEKLEAAEEQFKEGKVLDARESLAGIRAKHEL